MRDKFRLLKDWQKYKKGKVFDSFGGLVCGIAGNELHDGLTFDNIEYFEATYTSSYVKTSKQFMNLLFTEVQSEILRIQNKIFFELNKDENNTLKEAEEIYAMPYAYALNPSSFQLGKEQESEARETRIREILKNANAIKNKIQKLLSKDEKRFLIFVQESIK